MPRAWLVLCGTAVDGKLRHQVCGARHSLPESGITRANISSNCTSPNHEDIPADALHYECKATVTLGSTSNNEGNWYPHATSIVPTFAIRGAALESIVQLPHILSIQGCSTLSHPIMLVERHRRIYSHEPRGYFHIWHNAPPITPATKLRWWWAT